MLSMSLFSGRNTYTLHHNSIQATINDNISLYFLSSCSPISSLVTQSWLLIWGTFVSHSVITDFQVHYIFKTDDSRRIPKGFSYWFFFIFEIIITDFWLPLSPYPPSYNHPCSHLIIWGKKSHPKYLLVAVTKEGMEDWSFYFLPGSSYSLW